MASLALLTACGGGNAKKESAGDGTAETKTEAKASKSVKGEMETIDPKDTEIRKSQDFLANSKAVSGFEIGKPKGSTVQSAMTFAGFGIFAEEIGSYMIRFICGENQLAPKTLDAYAQAVWDNCKAVATDGKMYTDREAKNSCSSLEDAKLKLKDAAAGEVGYRYRWYYYIDGVVREMKIEPESSRNAENVRTERGIGVQAERYPPKAK